MKWLNDRSSKKRGRNRGLSKRNRKSTSMRSPVPQCEWLEQRQLLSVSPPISLGDIVEGNYGGTVTSPVVEYNGEQYFAFDPPTKGTVAVGVNRHHQQIWRTESTSGELVDVVQLRIGDEKDLISQMVVANGDLYFNWSNGLWKTDGTAAGTVVSLGPTLNIQRMVPLGDDLVVSMSVGHQSVDNEVYLFDTSTNTSTLLKNINNTDQQSVFGPLASVGDKVYFVADDGVHGREIWRTDGTTAGTVLVQDLRPGSAASQPADLTVIGDNVFFIAADASGVFNLWILDPGSTIIDDGAEDVLLGGLGATDWFFYDFDQDLLGDTIEVGEDETDSDP